jgi:hypothetical protein
MKMKIPVFEDPFYIYTELFVGSYRFPGCFRIVRKVKFRSVTMFVGLDPGALRAQTFGYEEIGLTCRSPSHSFGGEPRDMLNAGLLVVTRE